MIGKISKASREIIISRVSTLAVFLACIRCILEIWRIHYTAEIAFTYDNIKPFVFGAAITAISLLIITIFSYYGKYKITIGVGMLAVISMFVLKGLYL